MRAASKEQQAASLAEFSGDGERGNRTANVGLLGHCILFGIDFE